MFFINSLSEGIFPEFFKTDKFIAIFKCGDSYSTVDYRPISMLLFLSKIFEKLMCARLDSYLKLNDILCTNQFIIRKNLNTSEAIIEFLNYVYSSSNSKQSTTAVYLDFSKAFDTVNRNILMNKLLHNVVRGVKHHWFDWVTGNSWPTTSECFSYPYTVLWDSVRVTKTFRSCRPAWLEMDRKICPTATTSLPFNMSQSKSAIPLCQILHWVFHKDRCWYQYFFFCISMMTWYNSFLHLTVTLIM